MRFVYLYPETYGREADGFGPGPIPDVARWVEETGWDGIAFSEHPAPGVRWIDGGGHQTFEPFVALGAAAAVTTRITLLTYLAVAAFRSPMQVAKAAATLDRISGGRFVLGLGTGYQKSELHALGVAPADRGDALDRLLDVLPLHWSGEPFSYAGPGFDAREVIALPKPGPIPVWIGGNSARVHRRVIDRADGWMPLVVSASVAGTTGAADVTVADDIAKIRAEAGRELAFVVPYRAHEAVDPGDKDQHAQTFAELEAAGVTHVVVTGHTHDPAATRSYLEAFGSAFLR